MRNALCCVCASALPTRHPRVTQQAYTTYFQQRAFFAPELIGDMSLSFSADLNLCNIWQQPRQHCVTVCPKRMQTSIEKFSHADTVHTFTKTGVQIVSISLKVATLCAAGVCVEGARGELLADSRHDVCVHQCAAHRARRV